MLNNHFLSADEAVKQHTVIYRKERKITDVYDCQLTYVFHFQICFSFHIVFFFYLSSVDFFFLQKKNQSFRYHLSSENVIVFVVVLVVLVY